MNRRLLELLQPKLTEDEVRKLCREKKAELGFDIEKAMFPLNPLTDIETPTLPIEEAVVLLKEWAKVRDSVRGSVWGSVWDSVWRLVSDSVRGSVWGSVWRLVWNSIWDSMGDFSAWGLMRGLMRDSVRDSQYAYISSIFFNIKQWKGIEHAEGVNPFQPAIDLWNAGYIASFDGELWRLHAGPKEKVVWEGVK